MKKEDEVIERDEIMIEGTEMMTAEEAVEEDEGEDMVAEAEEVDIRPTEGIEKREMAIEMIEEISPQAKQDLATTTKMPEPRIITGRRMDGKYEKRRHNKKPP